MSIYRVIKNPDNPYVMINKVFLNNELLSWKAKGLLSYLLSLPDDWQVYESEITNHSKDGRDSTRSAIKELVKNGYIDRIQKHTVNGKFSGYEYIIYEDKNHVGLSDNGKTNNGKPPTTNNNLTNNDENNILHHYPNDGGIFNSIDEYTRDRFNKGVRQTRNRIYDIECLEDMAYDELKEFLDDNIKNYEQCNLDYIETIQYRAK